MTIMRRLLVAGVMLFAASPAYAIPVCEPHSVAPTLTEGLASPCQQDLNGNQRIIGTVTGTVTQQAVTSHNSQTSAANTANAVILAAVAGKAWTVRTVLVETAGTSPVCTLTIADGATTIFSLPVGGFTASPFAFNPGASGLTLSSGNAVTISVSACGVGNTSIVNVSADHP